jgi:hypothetical protein
LRTKWFFTIPENLAMLERNIVAEFIKVIPAEWTLRIGTLDAPYELIIAGEALNYTKLHFGSQINQMICGIDRGLPDIVGIIIKKKMPGQVEFGDHRCFGQCEVLSPAERVEVACYFIEAGYRGRLKFAKGEDDEEMAPMICEIFLPVVRPRGPTVFEINMDEKYDPNWAFDMLQFAKKCLQPFEASVGKTSGT